MPQRLPEAAAALLKTPLTVEQRVELIGELWDGIPIPLRRYLFQIGIAKNWNVG